MCITLNHLLIQHAQAGKEKNKKSCISDKAEKEANKVISSIPPATFFTLGSPILFLSLDSKQQGK